MADELNGVKTGERFADLASLYRVIGRPSKVWEYRAPDSSDCVCTFGYKKQNNSYDTRVVTLERGCGLSAFPQHHFRFMSWSLLRLRTSRKR